MAISFTQSVAASGLSSPTSLQFGPDGRLYVSQQNGAIKVYDVAFNATTGVWSTTLNSTISLVQQIPNHNDNGALNTGVVNRQVTGILVAGTAAAPVIYVTSSDPRISTNVDSNLDTNSGILSQLTYNGTSWSKVDLIRGLPRSEENHSTNGMTLSADGTKLYIVQGGNTNNGAPSTYFSNTPEYALSSSVLEVDLTALNAIPNKTFNYGNGVTSVYKYDLPTLVSGLNENAAGLDIAGPFGGNNGANQAILPADAPLRIYATGLRNAYDIVLTKAGQLFTIDNGSNDGLGGTPVLAGGKATNTIVNGGTGDLDGLNLLTDGAYYGHPDPQRSNPGATLPGGTTNLSTKVPASVQIQPGYLIDPSKFTSNAARLAAEGLFDPAGQSTASLVSFGASTNGLTEYTALNLGGALLNDLFAVSFDNKLYDIKLDATGKSVVSVTAVANISGTPLDVTQGPNGTLWVAQIGSGNVSVLTPTNGVVSSPTDIDNDGILDINDPFQADATNGQSTLVAAGAAPLVWDFSFGSNVTIPGPNGLFLGLTGHAANGVRDFVASSTAGGLDLANVKIGTAAGGGLVVVEQVSNGTASGAANTGEFLFQTGVKVASNVTTLNVTWKVINPFPGLVGIHDGQEIGGYIGTGDQSNFLKLVVGPNGGNEAHFVLESGGVEIAHQDINADALLTSSASGPITITLSVNEVTGFATPQIVYQNGAAQQTISGTAINLTGTSILSAIKGTYQIGGQTSGLAIGLWSTNATPSGEPAATTFSASFDSIRVEASAGTAPIATNDSFSVSGSNVTTLNAVGTGGQAGILDNDVAATGALRIVSVSNAVNATVTLDDKGTASPSDDTVTVTAAPGFGGNASFDYTIADSTSTQSTARVTVGFIPQSSLIKAVNVGGAAFLASDNVLYGADVAPDSGTSAVYSTSSNIVGTDDPLYSTERFATGGGSYTYNVAVPASGLYTVRLLFSENFFTTAGSRVFDVSLEGQQLAALQNIDVAARVGALTPLVIEQTVQVTDGVLNIQVGPGSQGGGGNVENAKLDAFAVFSAGPVPQSLSVADASVLEGTSASGFTPLNFALTLAQAAAQDVVVSYQLKAGATSPATPAVDFAGAPGTTLSNGIYSGQVTIAAGKTTANVLVNVVPDSIVEGNETIQLDIVSATSGGGAVQITDPQAIGTIVEDDVPSVFTGITPVDTYQASVQGSAVIQITAASGIQQSNFNTGSFTVQNTGGKRIAAVYLDATKALYPDTVFDPFGIAGDSVFKALTIDSAGNTGAVVTSNPYIGAGGTAGYEGALLTFNANANGGFQTGETITFSVDMDPNSIRGFSKPQLDSASQPAWDVGGVSGAELINSEFTVLFTDGTTAKAELIGDGSQGGAVGLATQAAAVAPASLTVNGLGAGGIGTYGGTAPVVTIQGLAGQTARVIMTKGFIQPLQAGSVHDTVVSHLAGQPFQANNAVQFETFDVKLTGAVQDISNLFDYNTIPGVASFPGSTTLPIGFVASIIDTTNGNRPISTVTDPIYLASNGIPVGGGTNAAPVFTSASTATVVEGSGTLAIDVNATDADGPQPLTYSLLGGADLSDFTINSATGVVSFKTVPSFATPVDADLNNSYLVTVGASDGLNTSQQALTINVVQQGTGGNFQFLLVDADNPDAVIEPQITQGEVISLPAAAFSGTFAVAAISAGLAISGPVNLTLKNLDTGQTFTKVESATPYSIFGDANGDYAGQKLAAGNYQFTATNNGQSQSVSFSLAQAAAGNVAPVITSPATAAVKEGTTGVALDVNATDANNDTLTYLITSGPDALLFNIDSGTGAVSFKTAPSLSAPTDQGGNNVYDFTVGVSDGKLTTTQSVAISVTSATQQDRFVFKLVNADTDQIINTDLSLGVGTLPAGSLQANLAVAAFAASGQTVTGPVTVALDDLATAGVDYSKVESLAPYSVFGDFNGNYGGVKLHAGSFTASATNNGILQSVTFTL